MALCGELVMMDHRWFLRQDYTRKNYTEISHAGVRSEVHSIPHCGYHFG